MESINWKTIGIAVILSVVLSTVDVRGDYLFHSGAGASQGAAGNPGTNWTYRGNRAPRAKRRHRCAGT